MGAAMRYQPQGLARLNLSNPLTRGLVFAWVPASDQLIKVGVVGRAFNPRGAAIVTDGSSSYEYQNSFPDISLDDCSITAILTPGNISSVSSCAVGCGSSSTNSPVFMLGQSATTGRLEFRTRDDSGTDLQANASLASWKNGSTVLATGTRSKDAGVQRLYANGLVAAEIAAGPRSMTSVFNRFCIGGIQRTGFGLPWAGAVALVLIHNRALSAQEAASLAANPWQVFDAGSSSSAYQAAIASTGGAPASATGSLAWTEASDSSAITASETDRDVIAWTEADDAHAIAGTLNDRAAIAWSEADDVYAALVTETDREALSWSEPDDVWALTATETDRAALAWTEDNDTETISASEAAPTNISSTIAWTEADDAQSLVGGASISSALGWAEAADGMSMAGAVATPAGLADTHDGGPVTRESLKRAKKQQAALAQARAEKDQRTMSARDALHEAIRDAVKGKPVVIQRAAPAPSQTDDEEEDLLLLLM